MQSFHLFCRALQFIELRYTSPIIHIVLCFLSAAMIHWARQIKEVLNTQDAFEMAETSGPLEEIEFWKNRCQDLSGISAQLDKPGVKKIEHILETAKSSYVAPFRKLASQIKVCVIHFCVLIKCMKYKTKKNTFKYTNFIIVLYFSF